MRSTRGRLLNAAYLIVNLPLESVGVIDEPLKRLGFIL
jgi:hypothetical protein